MSLATFSPHAATKSVGGTTTSEDDRPWHGGGQGGGDSSHCSMSELSTTSPLHNGLIEMPPLVLGAPMLTNAATSSRATAYTTPPTKLHSRNLAGNRSWRWRRSGDEDDYDDQSNRHLRWQHLYVLPVLLLEFLAIALTRAVLPSILLQTFGNQVYLVLGFADCIRGLLAFVACPVFGKLSDVVGRRICLLVTVIGSCAPVCSLALFSWNDNGMGMPPPNQVFRDESVANNETDDESAASSFWVLISSEGQGSDENIDYHLPPTAITIFVVLLMISGIFSSTFTLVFAYISDTVRRRDERVSAYGLALATFGLSFTIGPMAGGYMAQYNTHYVFVCSLMLTVVDVMYIVFVLPESTSTTTPTVRSAAASIISLEHNVSWSPWETLRIIAVDPFLRRVGQVAFLYYTGLWAIISTLSIYAVKRFHLSPERLGELMSALGLSTMIAEAVLVRVMVPLLGEKRSTRLGLLSFAMQCISLGLAYEGWHLFVCAAFSLLGNLVYPSLSSLVSGSVEPDAVGEALGAINGIKALTEGIGPLVFGSLMTLSEHSELPGWPYLLAAVLVLAAHRVAAGLPDVQDEEYIHELEFKPNRLHENHILAAFPDQEDGCVGAGSNMLMRQLLPSFSDSPRHRNVSEEEYQRLLSDVDEGDDEDADGTNIRSGMTRLPTTFASLVTTPPYSDNPSS